MEALWHLEDKLNLTTRKAVALFACTSLLLVAICLAAALRAKRLWTKGTSTIHQEPCTSETSTQAASPGRCSVVRALMHAVRWSGPSKWDESLLRQSQRESTSPAPLLAKRDVAGDVGWQSHNSTSAVWKKPILMGEKCELPRFSGLILYDQSGMPLHQCGEGTVYVQENIAPNVRTTLRDLL